MADLANAPIYCIINGASRHTQCDIEKLRDIALEKISLLPDDACAEILLMLKENGFYNRNEEAKI